jgi:hypothetical protein
MVDGGSKRSELRIDSCPLYLCAVGTREELIAEGLCTQDQFPEGRKRVACAPGGAWMLQRLKGAAWQFTRRHDEPQPARRDRGPEYDSPEAWRDKQHDIIRRLAYVALGFADGSYEAHTYGGTSLRLSRHGLARVRAALAEIEAAFESESVVWVGSWAEVQRRLPEARQDRQLQQFIEELSDAPKHSQTRESGNDRGDRGGAGRR